MTAAPTSVWMSVDEALHRLGCDRAALARFVERGVLTVYEIAGVGVRVRGDDLDSLPTPIPPEEAARRLLGDDPRSESPTMPTSAPASIEPVVPLKVAAEALGMPYKTMLRLVHAGEIPATNLGSPSRPRYVVDPPAIRRLWNEKAQCEMRKRSAPAATLDYSRLLSQTSKAVHRG